MTDSLKRLYEVIGRVTRRLDRVHGSRLRCARGCASCCVDDLTVFEVEAANIRRHHPDLLANGRPAPPGRCAFLDDEGACRIYEHRPYVCRTQGYPLRWIEESDAGDDLVELRDICPLNEAGAPIVELPPRDCWSLGPAELRLHRLQSQLGPDGARVHLRDLFRSENGTDTMGTGDAEDGNG